MDPTEQLQEFKRILVLRRLGKLTLLSLNRVTHTQNRIQKALRQLVIIRAAGACCWGLGSERSSIIHAGGVPWFVGSGVSGLREVWRCGCAGAESIPERVVFRELLR
jgi:hypothetical protein